MQRVNDVLRIELVYDADCPNVERARAVIRAALEELGADGRWTEWNREDAATPDALRSYGSPTVLVNGRDVGCDDMGAAPAHPNSCRLYVDDGGCLRGTPSIASIVNAIRFAQRR